MSNTLGAISEEEAARLKQEQDADPKDALRRPLETGEAPAFTGNLLADVAARAGLSYEETVARLADLLVSQPLTVSEIDVAGEVDIRALAECILDIYKQAGHPVLKGREAALMAMVQVQCSAERADG